MAIEQNPFEQIPTEENINVLPEAVEEEDMNATFEVDDDGGVIVDFSSAVEMEANEEIGEWYDNLAEDMDDGS